MEESEANFGSFPYESGLNVTLPALHPPWQFEWCTCGLERMRNVYPTIQNRKQKKQRVMEAIHNSF